MLCLLALAGCGARRSARAPDAAVRALIREARPIGHGPRFRPPARRRVAGAGACRRALGPRFPVHIEVFAADRVVIVPAGIGVGRPWSARAGRIDTARCFGSVVTLDPTGVVLVPRDAHLTLGSLFDAWGQPLSARTLAGFTGRGNARVRVYVDGRPRRGSVRAVPLTPDAEIVLEIGPHVPPHVRYAFPPRPHVSAAAGRTPAG
jgi:hypothetical protein